MLLFQDNRTQFKFHTKQNKFISNATKTKIN